MEATDTFPTLLLDVLAEAEMRCLLDDPRGERLMFCDNVDDGSY